MIPINILIVDDKEESIIALKALLERERNDIRIFSATSVNQALKLALEKQISIALIDIQMPEMNGFALTEMLKSNSLTKDILIIFVTALSEETTYAVRGFGSGATDYLYKPLDPYRTAVKLDSFIQLARYQSEIKQKNKELENYETVVNNSADIICVVDALTFQIQSINPAVEKIMGYRPEELLDESIIDFAVEQQKPAFRKKLVDIITNNLSSSVFEFQFVTFTKSIIWAECRVAWQNKAIFINISDISPHRGSQNDLAKSKKTEDYGKKVKETFLANMSHELRTPVNGIIGLTGLLRKTPLNEQQSSMIDLLEVSSQSLLGVINDILDISKIDAGKLSIVRSANNLHDLIRSLYGLLKFKADENDIEFLLEISPEVPSDLIVDSLRLNQVLMNLLSNAIKFTERGFVKLSVQVLQKYGDQVKLKFTIEDTGIGIPENKISSVFDSFEQADEDTSAKYGGTGLGLAIVKRLVELKGGELEVSSSVGKGSAFSFINWYTVSVKTKEKGILKTVNTLEQFENVNILVAEDNLVNQFMLSKIFKEWGIDIEIVDTGLKVLEKLRNNSYDLVLMDTHMPEMNGYETAKAIRADFNEPMRSIPIISLSAASFDHEREEAILAGMNEVLSKPFQLPDLHGKIQKLLAAGLVKDQV